ncbi:unnamed protein product [Cladocopium goreaui]|uniref:Inositol-1-monophosphatase n=1 Tax=Cladocopium goreaui TaxID=2562237 RepID=A0A9P1FRR5_9DINO|nr:unnamed protein product [Cladocopium goreaui]
MLVHLPSVASHGRCFLVKHASDRSVALPLRPLAAIGVAAAAAACGRRCFRCHRTVRRCEDAKVLEVAEQAARAAGCLIREQVGAKVIRRKAFAADLLTAVDQQCEEAIRKIVQDNFPSHAFLGEETAETTGGIEEMQAQEGWLWVVDPIDGTTNFASGQPMSAVSIGVAKDGQLRVGVIYEPFRDELFTAQVERGAFLNGQSIRVSDAKELSEAVVASGCAPNPKSSAPCLRAMTELAPKTRTLRILGSAAVNFAWLACGRLDAWFEVDLNAWDNAAGALLVQEAGGLVTDCKGSPYTLSTRPICATNGLIHFELLEILAKTKATELDP